MLEAVSVVNTCDVTKAHCLALVSNPSLSHGGPIWGNLDRYYG